MVKIMVKIMVPTTRWRTMVAQGGSQLKMFAPGKTSKSSSSPWFPSIFFTALLWKWKLYMAWSFLKTTKRSPLWWMMMSYSNYSHLVLQSLLNNSSPWLDSLPWNRLDQVLRQPDCNFSILFGYWKSIVTYHFIVNSKHWPTIHAYIVLVNLYSTKYIFRFFHTLKKYSM